ncbi:MAG: PspA/IM30 family protein [Sphingomonadaceae bacterium]|uniref:PspA/IM30 family protein n=1 Tax=Thermaurantiacus sp. TaxID=2820283 RepID=UPI00298F105B|nr:PspA/IM30 family protein [Thermaurantiacus sp.]MCS6985912.1 PspA/IM30 family protein [Sphingomonadaceae bacterium]MDW8414872.1 PspA/IM30 family protein [Thermaurantiacus sp.]
MGIFSRARDIIEANLADILAGAEDPARTIDEMIVEMDETLAEVRAAAARVIADGKDVKRTLGRLRHGMQEWTARAELALTKGRDDLAHAALVEKRRLEEMAEALESELAALDARLRTHEDDIASLEARLREARARREAIRARLETAVTRRRVRELLRGDRLDQALLSFDRLERAADAAEGQADALALGTPQDLAARIAALDDPDPVRAELEALKARLRDSRRA